MSTIAAHMGVNSNVFLEISSTYPTPLVLEKYSESTIMITASDTLVRMPAAICGDAAGSTMRRIASRYGMLYERAVSIIVGSIPRTPSIVFSRIGKMQKNAMNAIFWRLPIEWTRRIEIGSSAGGGIARQYSMCGIAHSRAQR